MSNTALTSIQNQLTGNGEGVELIGHQVFWSLSEESAVAYEELKQVAVNAGFEAKSHHEGGVLPRPTTPCSAWSRAIAEFKKSRHVRDRGIVIDSENVPADSDTKTPAKGLLTAHHKSVNSGESKVTFEQQIAIEFDKTATPDQTADQVMRVVNGEGEIVKWVYDSIVYYYNLNLSRVNVNDVRATIKRILHKVRAFKMRPSGGLYYVPVQYSATVEALRKFVASLNGSHLYTLDLPKLSVRTIETVKQTAAEAMEQELEQLKKDIATGLKSTSIQKNGADSATHGRLVDLINDYRARAEFYADYLAVQKEEIDNAVGTLERQIEEAIS